MTTKEKSILTTLERVVFHMTMTCEHIYKLGGLGHYACEHTATIAYEEAEFLAEGYADFVIEMVHNKSITSKEAKERAIALASKLKNLWPELDIKEQVLWTIQRKYNKEIEQGLITFLKEQA